MIRRFFRLSALIVVLAPSLAQPTQTPLHFEVADVHASPRGAFPEMSGGMMGAGRYELHSATMLDLIRVAWGVAADKVIGGPSWMGTDRFEVIAKAAPDTALDAVPAMLQELLADRFGLRVHPDKQPLPSFVLTAGTNPKLKRSDGSGDAGCETRRNLDAATIACRNTTMARFAASIGGMAALSHPVLDETQLNGAWDFNVTWTPRPGGPGDAAFIDALGQLGLKLAEKGIPVSVLVVEKVNETPAPNAPDVTKDLPPPPAQFEAAVVKPSAPGETSGGRFLPGGRVDLRAIPLRRLVMTAWGVSDDRILGAPKWMSTERFDIQAEAPSSAQPGAAVGLAVDMDAMKAMLRALIVDRFKLTFHYEERPLPVYALVVTKSGLMKRDPSSHAGCKQGGGSLDKNTAPVFTYTCQGTTMAEFAVKLRQLVGGEEVDHPVIDATALDGAWDFEFRWSPALTAPALGGTGEPSDPTGDVSLKEALNKQLGLKLVLEQRPMPVLVIDHVDEKPAAN